ncbi:MAG: hypothetical protein DRP27_01770 [Thermotogae bacterium]|nr:MAG: hypothetical protein DRP27_01770 [Thermotogota bacterium]
MRRLSERFATFVMSNWKLILAFYVPLLLISVFFTLQLGVDPELTKVLEKDDPVLKEYLDFQRYAAGQETLALVVKTGGKLNTLIPRMFHVIEKLQKSDVVEQIVSTGAPESLRFYGLFALSSQQLEEIVQRIEGLSISLSRLNPFDFNTVRLLGNAINALDSARIFLDIDGDNLMKHLMISPDREILVITIIPTGQITDMEHVSRVVKEFHRIAQEELGQDYEWGFTGSYASTYDGQKQLYRDFFVTSAVSLGMVIFLFLVGYGNLILTGLVLVVVGSAMFFTLALARLLFGSLNVVTTFVNAITLGLGIDFSIHVLTHIHEEYKQHRAAGSAVWNGLVSIISPLFIGALTTGTVFGLFVLVGSPALVELGIVSALGIGVFFTMSVTLLPSLFMLARKRFDGLKFGSSGKIYYLLAKHVPSFGSIFTVFVLIAAGYASYAGIRNYMDFSYTPPGFSSSDAPYVKYGKLISQHFGSDFLNEVVGLVPSVEQLPTTMERLRKSPLVAEVSSIYNLVGSNISEEGFSEAKRIYRIIGENARNPLVVAVMQKYKVLDELLNAVAVSLHAKNPTDVVKAVVNKLPEEYRKLFVYEDSNGGKWYVVRIRPSIGLYGNNGLKRFVEEMKRLDVKIVGYPYLMYHVSNKVRKAVSLLVVLAAFAVYVIILLGTRAPIISLVMLTTLAVVIMATFGVMRFMGIEITFINLLSAPLIVGIGVDAMVHLWHARSASSTMKVARTLKAITFSSATTAAAFLSLGFAEGKILEEFGLSMTLGIAISWFLSVFVVYAIFGGEKK